MATGKTVMLTFRIEPELEEALRTAAERGHRSIANMVAVLIMVYCGSNDIAISEKNSRFDMERHQPVKALAGKREKKS